MTQTEQALVFPRFLEESRWSGGVRIVMRGAMQVQLEHGSADMHACWGADVFYGKSRKPDFTLIAESVARLLFDLAMLAEPQVMVEIQEAPDPWRKMEKIFQTTRGTESERSPTND